MDVNTVRDAFPAMARDAAPTKRIFFDNPAGTQMAGRSIERMTRAMIETNANLGGYFETSLAAQAMVDDAHQAMADFFNAADPREVVFGQNMTTLTFAVSRAIGRDLNAGDAIVLTRMDHDANVLRAASNTPPGKFETGTTSREALAGVLGAVEHYAWLGQSFGNIHPQATRRERIVAGIKAADRYERVLTARLIAGLSRIDGVVIQGITDVAAQARRVPTVSITVAGADPADIAKAMAKEGIYLWHGHNYGLEPIRRLGLADRNGVVRIGLAHYNTAAEVDFLLAKLADWMKMRT